MDISRYEMSLARAEQSMSQIQDPQEVHVNRRDQTFGQGSRCLPTGGEIAEKELQQYDSQPQTLVHPRQIQPTYDNLPS